MQDIFEKGGGGERNRNGKRIGRDRPECVLEFIIDYHLYIYILSIYISYKKLTILALSNNDDDP